MLPTAITDDPATLPLAALTTPFWPLQRGDQDGHPLSEAAARHLYDQAFGPAFTTDRAITYRQRYGTWLAMFTWKGIAVDVCFNAPDVWRVSHALRCDSIPFLNDERLPVRLSRLTHALDRLASFDAARLHP